LEENSVKVFALLAISTLTLNLPVHAGTINGNVRLANSSGTSTTPTAGDREPVVLWLQESNAVNTPTPPPLTISQRKLQFTPNFLVVPQGRTINFPNDDDVAHNVYVIAGPNQFNFGLYPKGQEKSMVFSQPGLVDMYCSIHPQMHARIFVVPSPYFATTLPGHSFSIANVPPGRYTLKVWHERSHILTKTVTVPANGAVNENITLENVPSHSTTAKD
jgi:plastocyanin